MKIAFTEEEWAILEKDKKFMRRYEAVQSLEDVEKACVVAHEIVLESRGIKKPR